MKKIGLLIPSTNLTVENELQFLYESNTFNTNEICFYTSKLAHKTSYKEDKEKFLNDLAENSILKSKELKYLGLDYIAYFCTSSAVLNQKDEMRNNPAEAIIEIAKNRNVKKCLLITPYNEKLGNDIKKHLEQDGIEVTDIINLNLLNTFDYFNYGKVKLEDLILRHYKTEYESIIISCTNLPTIHFIHRLEKQLDTKIISSNSSMFWKIAKDNNIKLKSNMLGGGK